MRRYLLTLLLASLGLPLTSSSTLQAQTTSPATTQSYELIKLPYASDALAPVISKRTVELHHGKHLAGYVSKLNSLLKESGMPGSIWCAWCATARGLSSTTRVSCSIITFTSYSSALLQPRRPSP